MRNSASLKCIAFLQPTMMQKTALGLVSMTLQALAAHSKHWSQPPPPPPPQQQQQPVDAAKIGGVRDARSNAKDGAGPTCSKSFWCSDAEEVALRDVKRRHAYDRFLDKKARTAVRQRLRDGGVMSNLFPVHVSPDTTLYIYDLEATRRLLQTRPPDAQREKGAGKSKGRRKKGVSRTVAPAAVAAADDPIVKRVDATRAWRVMRRFLQRCVPAAPPLVCVRHKVYALSPIPTEALQLPAEYLDLGWVACKLRSEGKVAMAQLSPADLQDVTNKIVAWTLGWQGNQHKKFMVARETDGKLVWTHKSFSVEGIRLFKGAIVRAVFIDATGAVDALTPAAAATAQAVPSTAVLTTLKAGHYPTAPLQFLVKEFVREFEFKSTSVQSYKIQDASGVIMASLWKATMAAKLSPGAVYEATDYRVRVFENRGGMRLVEMTTGETALRPVLEGESASGRAKSTRQRQTPKSDASVSGKKGSCEVACDKRLSDATKEGAVQEISRAFALKIDTKSTVAAELSIWEEVKQHFGNGPYDSDTEQRIAQSVQRTPVIISATLRHSVIRLVRFNIVSNAVSLDPLLLRLLPDLEPGQPYAVLNDHSVVPLQALHCCYDPCMKLWQDIVVSTCSFLPTQRLDILKVFHTALRSEMQRWGLILAAEPFSSKALSLLPTPQKVTAYGVGQRGPSKNEQSHSTSLRHVPPPPFPTTLAVVAIAPPHVGEEERARITQTAQAVARYHRSSLTITVPNEDEAGRFLLRQLTDASGGATKDPNTAAVIISAERETRSSRWLLAECLTRGILAFFVPPAANLKRQNILCANVKVQLRTKFGTDPAHGVDVAREVPALAQRRVLVVGVDACHTTTFSTGSVVGILCAPERNHLLPFFWKHEMRGEETDRVTEHFHILLQRACELYDGVDEVVVFQDGDVYSEARQMRAHLPPGCGFTFMCLHKRTNVRFVQRLPEGSGFPKITAVNVAGGAVVQGLTPISLLDDAVAPSFYLQNHDCSMSTARTVQYIVHNTSPTLDVSDVQQLSHVLSHVQAPQATKLPMAARCAHRLSSVAERLLDAVPPFTCDMIPAPLNERLWFF
ncbi:putative PIWI-like protein 1 [Trypanosoma rangeli]|uniref:Putative PIWI-like protein 1 n=1 Tax=Trypanosoma rangeli TaxID=5698 RepID=A0A3R7KPA6_TRYRA|nr:putative PIWI-like protein 1 [Trypanosoma rangeli]RNE98649.1 putative PIWI-like protein 1 [Trypanosoma rangeli]|eukprot:RNE98649.1 putative PIWI-like protein 1 [Trypanosoma rangeli]